MMTPTEQALDALTEIDARLKTCAADHIDSADCYDSFYQEIVSQAIAALEAQAQVTDERAMFEAWAKAAGYEIHRDETDKYRDYHRATTRFAWQAWQARAKPVEPVEHEQIRNAALDRAATLVELEYAPDAQQGKRLAQIAQHIRDLKKRSAS